MVVVISSNSLFYYNKNSNNDSYSYYHIAYADANANTNGTKSFKVTIPKGSANPQVDISKLGPRQWYLPREITVRVNDTVTWTNNDTEAHTVTSGIGAGIESLMNNKKGTSNGLFGWGSVSHNHYSIDSGINTEYGSDSGEDSCSVSISYAFDAR